jgi:hypothetical protein
MSEEKDKSGPEDSDLEDSVLEEVEEGSYGAPPDEDGFEIVMEIERAENWPPPPDRIEPKKG